MPPTTVAASDGVWAVAADPLPRVAVLLSTYNGEAFLAAQLDSLLAQQGVTVEVFARDDGSSDRTRDILARYSGHWPQLAAPRGGDNLGPAASFLELLFNAPDGFDLYAFCDQDDVWLPDKLARAARQLAESAADRPALYCSRVMCVDEALRPLGEKWIRGGAGFEHLLFENVAYGATVVLNAAAITLITARLPAGGAIMHDWWCALAMSAVGEIVQDERPGLLYRQHADNVIGAPGPVAALAGRLHRLSRNPRRFHPIHAQAEAFLRAWADDLKPADLRSAKVLVESRRSLAARLGFAAFGRVVRGRLFDALALRLLIALNWY